MCAIMDIKTGGDYMISYKPLWETMERKKASTYTLQVKGGISSSTIQRLRSGQSISTNTIEALCKILDCTPSEIFEYIPDSTPNPTV